MFRGSGHGIVLELITTALFLYSSVHAAEANCPCISSHGLPKDSQGLITFTDPATEKEYKWPGSYGLNECKKHDELLPPFCADDSIPFPTAPSWCEESWCYVNATQCKSADLTKTFVFADQNPDLYYSFETCGSNADTFASWSRSAGKSALELVDTVESYLLSEIKPLSGSTLRDSIEWTSSECQDGWTTSCDCDTCAVLEESAWGDVEVNLGSTSITVQDESLLEDQDLTCLTKVVGRQFRNIARNEYDASNRVGFLYMGLQENGGYFQWPGMQWCTETFDPRYRPWYAAAVSGPKDVVLLIDKSGSMGLDRMQAAVEAARAVLETLGDYDYATIVFFEYEAHPLSSKLERMDEAGKARLEKFIEVNGKSERNGGTDFKNAFTEAFKIMRNGEGSGCEKMILFLTDGQDTSDMPLSMFDTWNPDQDVRIFSYIIGDVTPDLVAKPATIACTNGGKYHEIRSLDQIKDTMADYFRFFADSEANDLVRWIDYTELTTGERLIAGCLSLFRGKEVFSVACMDITVMIPLEELEAKGSYNAMLQEMETLSTKCQPFTVDDDDLDRLRGDSECTLFMDRTCPSCPVFPGSQTSLGGRGFGAPIPAALAALSIVITVIAGRSIHSSW